MRLCGRRVPLALGLLLCLALLTATLSGSDGAAAAYGSDDSDGGATQRSLAAENTAGHTGATFEKQQQQQQQSSPLLLSPVQVLEAVPALAAEATLQEEQTPRSRRPRRPRRRQQLQASAPSKTPPADYLLPYPPDAEHGLHESSPRAVQKRREMAERDGGTFESFPASQTKGTPPFMRYIEDTVPTSQRLITAHISFAEDPLRTFSIAEPPRGCSNTSNNRELTSVSAKHHSCSIAGNAGFFKVSTGACHGNLVSDGRVVQNTGRQNVNFGIQKNGTIVVGYLLSSDIVDAEERGNPFVQLIAGVVWLVRNGEVYVDESLDMEDMTVQETGTSFPDIISGRAALGHDLQGRVVLYQVDGHTDKRGINLYELAELLVARGVWNAINLDGGGSMTSILDGTLVSYPSDSCASDPSFKCERKVTTIVCLHDVRCTPADCSGHGTCIPSTETTASNGVAGTCDCDFGWRPPNCSVPVNPCEDADYFDYLDWYALHHNGSVPGAGGGSSDGGGGGYVPDNDRRRSEQQQRRENAASLSSSTLSALSALSTLSTLSHETKSEASQQTTTAALASPGASSLLPVSSHSSPALHSTTAVVTSTVPSSTPPSATPSSATPRSVTPSSATPSSTIAPSHTPRPRPTTPGGCHVNATCSYLGPGRHSCGCNAGFYGNGSFCQALPHSCVYPSSSLLPFSTSVSSTPYSSTPVPSSATPSATPPPSSDSNSLINPECLPWAYWLIALGIISLLAVAVSLYVVLSHSRKLRRLASSGHGAPPKEEAMFSAGGGQHPGSRGSRSLGASQPQSLSSSAGRLPDMDESASYASAMPQDRQSPRTTLGSSRESALDGHRGPSGPILSMKTFVKGLVSSGRPQKKSLGSGPPFFELSGDENDDNRHIMNDVDVFGDDDSRL